MCPCNRAETCARGARCTLLATATGIRYLTPFHVTGSIKALDDFGIEKLTIMANEIYDTGKIPQDLSKSIFIALPKKPGTIECELHRTIRPMSHITKVILRVIMMRVRRCTKPEINQEQCGFVEDTDTRNAILLGHYASELLKYNMTRTSVVLIMPKRLTK